MSEKLEKESQLEVKFSRKTKKRKSSKLKIIGVISFVGSLIFVISYVTATNSLGDFLSFIGKTVGIPVKEETKDDSIFEPLKVADIKSELPEIIHHDIELNTLFDVYSGPGYDYYQENGKAQIRLSNLIYTIASDEKWWLIRYILKREHKVGYIYTKGTDLRFTPPSLLCENIIAYTRIQSSLWNYPVNDEGSCVIIPAQTEVLVLCKYKNYIYLETTYMEKRIRGFMLADDLHVENQ